MTEMNAISRFFVNAFGARRNVRRTQWIVDRWTPSPGLEFLEFGCGNADLAARLYEAFRPSRYVATDLDPDQVAAARRHLARRYPEGVPKALEVNRADLLSTDFRDASFDAVFAFTSIHHAGADHRDFGPIPQALGEIDRVLRPSGYLVYEEFLHLERIRDWLSVRAYAPVARGRRWRTETVIVRKSSELS